MSEQSTKPYTEMDAAMDASRAREMGSIIRSLYIALGGATLLRDEKLIDELRPLVLRYRNRTRTALEGTPYE